MHPFIDHSYTYAVIGASHDPEKYGNKVFKDLLDGEYNVFGVNPKGGELHGQALFTSVAEIGKGIDVAVFVVPPQVVEQVLPTLAELGIKKFWMQPGSESDVTIKYCEDNGLECMHNACIMVQRKVAIKQLTD